MWLLTLLEFFGRKKVLAHPDGTVIANRWYVFYKEEDEDKRLIAMLPNVYIHQNLKKDTPDGPDSHHHAWPTRSLILSGGYWEEVDGVERFNGRWSVADLKYTQLHRIVKCLPNTWTLFMHGFRLGPWGFKSKPCTKVCDTCASRYGECFNVKHETPYDLHFGGKGAFRAVRWFDSNEPGLEDRLARRRKAILKVRQLSRDEVNARAAKIMLERENAKAA